MMDCKVRDLVDNPGQWNMDMLHNILFRALMFPSLKAEGDRREFGLVILLP